MENFNGRVNQIGASMWGLLFGAGLVVLFALVTMKLIPAYLDNNKVAHALESLAEQPGVGSWNRRQIQDRIDNTLYVDMAADMLDLNQALKPKIAVGERIRLPLVRAGRDEHQAVGYLPDGSMIVVNNAVSKINTTQDVTVISTLETEAGTMVFSELFEREER